jgi:acetate kinase
MDPELNASHGRETGGRITSPSSGLLALVIRTSEERAIAEQVATFLPSQ